MAFQLEFPDQEDDRIVETPLMRAVVSRTMAVHPGAVVIWSGPARNGKTMCAKWMKRKADDAYGSSPNAFRILHYEVGEIERWSGNEMKRGVRSLHHATVGKIAESVYRQLPIEDLAKVTVGGLRAKNVRMILIDEAGLLSLDALRGMILVRNVAQNLGWPLSLVFIGMDDLPIKVRELSHVRYRIHEWCYFKPYPLQETYDLLAALDPHFAGLDLNRVDDQLQVEFIHEQFGGLPGLIVPFLRRVRYHQRKLKLPITLALLRAVHLRTVRDEESAVTDAINRYQGPEHSAEEIDSDGALLDPDLDLDGDESASEEIEESDVDEEVIEEPVGEAVGEAVGDDALDDLQDAPRSTTTSAGDDMPGDTAEAA